MLRVLGIGHVVDGVAPIAGGLLVVNHVSWLDIMAIHAVVPAGALRLQGGRKAWPLLARLVDAGGTLYLERERKRDALRVVHAVAQSLSAGQTVAIFPGGHDLDRPRPAAVPCQPAAGGDRGGAAGPADRPALLGIGQRGQPSRRVRRPDDDARKPLGHGVRRRRRRAPRLPAARATPPVPTGASSPCSCATTSRRRSASTPTRRRVAPVSGPCPARPRPRRPSPPLRHRRGSSCGSASAHRRARRRAGCRSGC